MIQKIRKSIPYLLPIIAAVLIIGLILSRVVDTGPSTPKPEITISASEAVNHVGTLAEVCGRVASADYLPNVKGRPTFLNLDEAHPDAVFTAVIFGEDRNLFRAPPEEVYIGRKICVSGTIRMHEAVPQIVVSGPGQISLSVVDE